MNIFFEGTIVMGNQLGRTIGYPTANLEVEDQEKLIPGNGVYAVEAALVSGDIVNGELSMVNEENASTNTDLVMVNNRNSRFTIHNLHKGMMNVGMRPTVNGTKRTIEVNLFDFDKDIYGQTLRVFVKHYLRGEVKFTGLDALKAQLAQDKLQSLELLRNKE